jgi:hypothetical protein
MPQIESCLKCKSQKVIPRARIIDRADYNLPTDLTVHVYENPDAFVFKIASQGTLRARICGECGFVETFVENPVELYSAYLRAKSRQG